MDEITVVPLPPQAESAPQPAQEVLPLNVVDPAAPPSQQTPARDVAYLCMLFGPPAVGLLFMSFGTDVLYDSEKSSQIVLGIVVGGFSNIFMLALKMALQRVRDIGWREWIQDMLGLVWSYVLAVAFSMVIGKYCLAHTGK